MTQSRLRWLLASMVALILLRWWFPPGGDTAEESTVVPAVVRAPGPASAPAGNSHVGEHVPMARTNIEEARELPGNAFAVRVIRQVPEPPPPAPVKVVAFMGPPEPPPPPPPPPSPPPPPLQVIGTWNDGVAPGVFVSTGQGTVLARPGTVLLAEYQVTAVTAQQISITHTATKHVWQIPVPRAPGIR